MVEVNMIENILQHTAMNMAFIDSFPKRYTPQQNGVAQGKDQTIMNMARSMLKAKNFPNEHWGEGVAFLVYILDKSPTKSVKDKILLEGCGKMQSSVSHLKVFGYIAYAYIPKEIRNKLDDTSEKCIFVEYSEQSKAYKLYNPIMKKEIISRDVKFLEDKSWNNKVDAINQNQPFPHAFEPAENSEQQESMQRFPRLQVQGETSNQRGKAPYSTSSNNDSNSTIPSLRDQKVKSLKDLYEKPNDLIETNDTLHLVNLVTGKSSI